MAQTTLASKEAHSRNISLASPPTQKFFKRKRSLREGRNCILRTMVLTGIVVGVFLPMLPLFVWSISHRWWFPAIIPTELSMRAWSYIASPLSQIGSAFLNSLVIACLVTIIAILIGIPAGRALGMHAFKGKTLVEFIILAPVIIPSLAVVMGIHVFFIKISLVDTIPGVVIVHLLPTLPYMVMVMAGVFANYDSEFEEQSYSLGANKANTFFLVILPNILPGIVTGGLFVFLISWSQYILTVLIGGGRVVTLPLLLFAFAGAGDNAVTAALCIVFIAPAIIILVATSRYLSGESSAIGGFGRT